MNATLKNERYIASYSSEAAARSTASCLEVVGRTTRVVYRPRVKRNKWAVYAIKPLITPEGGLNNG